MQSVRRERSAHVGLDAPGLPFDGFPVFRFSPRDATGEWCVAPLVDFRAPSRPRTSLLPAAPARVPIGSRRPRPALGSHRPACASQSHHPSTAAFLSVPCSTAHEVEGIRRSPRALAPARRPVAGARKRSRVREALKPRGRPYGRTRDRRRVPASARGPLAAFLRSQRTVCPPRRFARATADRSQQRDPAHVRSAHPSPTDRVSFTPATLVSFHLQGLAPDGDRNLSPGSRLPCRSASLPSRHRPGSVASMDDAIGFAGLGPPSRQIVSARRIAAEPEPPVALLAFSPLRLSLPPP